ncbi:DinB family protein [Actinophytocola sp.]|uniref:DinB family protein n=1 Tax=Actinophytocola sp. TaxID=1872138 RepID=UPI003D6C55B0
MDRDTRDTVHRELDDARATFHRLVAAASPAELRRPSDGTKWTNKQLLFHMLLGYLIIRALGTLVRVFGRLPDGAGRAFARLLNAATTPFDAVNYLGSRLGGSVLGTRRMGIMFDHVVAALHRRLDAETDADLARGMHYPTRWDPFFADYMTLADLYRFPTRHFDFHRRQLTLDAPARGPR